MTKKCIVLFLIAILITAMMLPMTANAKTAVTYIVGSVTHDGVIEAGETITIPVSVRSDSPLCAMQMDICYDPAKWEVTQGVETEFLKKNFMFHELNTAPVNTETGEAIPGKVRIGGMTAADVTVSGEVIIAQLTFKALCTIENTEHFVIEDMRAAKAPVTQMDCVGVNGIVVIEREAPAKGDVNLDGTVALSDATQLFYAVNGLLTLDARQQAGADMDADGNITLADATLLFYTVNGLV